MGKEKKLVTILFGGQSKEHDISCMSAYSVINNIDRTKYDIRLVGISKQGTWIPYEGNLEKIKDASWQENTDNKYIGEAFNLLYESDIIFPILHGQNGEDGTVQGLCELLSIPYVGCNVLASALAMDKGFAKIIFKDAGLKQCKHILVTRHEINNEIEKAVYNIEEKIGYPCFVKPSNSGSSVGVFKCSGREDLIAALHDAKKIDRRILVEEYINGREIECAVLGNEKDAEVAIPGEIIPSKEFYDFEDKYLTGASKTQIPANLPIEKVKEVKRLAKKAYKALDGSGLSRVDFFYKEDTGEFLLNEINTMPGFTEISMYSKMWEASGLSYKDLLTRLIELAIERKEETKRDL